jgi:spore coat polysaccharide biosynthesis protein SpsF
VTESFPSLRVIIIVQARMGSTRLPGKSLKSVLGKPLLCYLLERLRRCQKADEVVLATTTLPEDDPIVETALKMGVPVVRGSSEDLVSRYLQAAHEHHADVVVRVTGDCPLIDPEWIDRLIVQFIECKNVDYLSNTIERTFPRGMDAEVFSIKALEETDRLAVQPAEREHVTLFMYRHPEQFRLKNVRYPEDHSRHRWTVDTAEDFQLIEQLLSAIYPINKDFSLADLLALINLHPEWELLNKHIEQKTS